MLPLRRRWWERYCFSAHVHSPLRASSVDYTFALLGYKNHDLYFGHLGGEGGEPTGRFAELVDPSVPSMSREQALDDDCDAGLVI